MSEIADILAAWHPGESAALATVVRLDGSGDRRPGARLLILGDGLSVGAISGGCIERDVVHRAGGVIASGEPALVRYESMSEEEAGPGAMVGCGGTLDILIEPADNALHTLQWLWTRREAGVIVTVIAQKNTPFNVGSRLALDQFGEIRGDGSWLTHAVLEEARKALAIGQSRTVRHAVGGGWVDLFVEVIQPPLELFIFGAGPDAAPLAAMAKSMGWRVTIVDLRTGSSIVGRTFDADEVVRPGIDGLAAMKFTGQAAVVMTHTWKTDLAALDRLAGESLKYLGVLGPRHRTDRLLSHLDGPQPAAESFHYPIGLDIGAETPREVALAIVAEITAVLHQCGGGPLRDKAAGIHATSDNPCPVAAS